MLNHCTLIGKVVATPEEKSVGQKSVLNLRIKTWESYGGNTYDSYHTINIWSEYDKKEARAFQEGALVMVQGKYSTRKVEKNGQSSYFSSLTASAIKEVDINGTVIRQGDDNDDSCRASTPPQGRGRGAINTGNPAPNGYSSNTSEDEVPF